MVRGLYLLVLLAIAAAPAQVPVPPQAPFAEEEAAPALPEPEGYAAGSRRAVREGRRLAVWVRCWDAGVIDRLPEWVHCRTEAFEDRAAPRVVVGAPDGKGWLDQCGEVPAGEVTVERLTAAAARRARANHGAVRYTGVASPPVVQGFSPAFHLGLRTAPFCILRGG